MQTQNKSYRRFANSGLNKVIHYFSVMAYSKENEEIPPFLEKQGTLCLADLAVCATK